MKSSSNTNSRIPRSALLQKRMLQGAGLAVILLILVFSVGGRPNPDYVNGSLRWMVLPLILVPTAGALGGMVYFYTERFRKRGRWYKVFGYILSLLAYGILLLIAFSLGMRGPN